MGSGPYLELDQESDRASAVLCAAFLDHELASVLRQFMRDVAVAAELFTGTEPLATFSARTKMAYVLGLIDERTYRDLNLIRRIRNEFAHARELKSFADQDVASRCRELRLPEIVPSPPALPRARFETAVKVALGVLSTRRLVAHDQRRVAPDEQPAPKAVQVFEAGDIELSTYFHVNRRTASLTIELAAEAPLEVRWRDPEELIDLSNQFRLLAASFRTDDAIDDETE